MLEETDSASTRNPADHDTPFPDISGIIGKKAAHFQNGWRGKVPLDLVELDEMLAFSLLRYPFVRMYESRGAAPIAAYTTARSAGGSQHPGFFSYGDAMSLFADGYAIELGAVHQWHPLVARLADMLAKLYGVEVDAQIFITPPAGQGLSVHRDLADGLALHLAGAKRWRVHRRSESQWTRGATDDPGELEIDVIMERGDVLYFPAGAAHEVVSVSEQASAHVTFGLQEPGRTSVASALIDSAPAADLSSAPLDDEQLAAWLDARVSSLLTATASVTAGEVARRARTNLLARNALPALRLSKSYDHASRRLGVAE